MLYLCKLNVNLKLKNMKKLIVLIVFFITTIGLSQEKETVFEKVGDLVKATYYYENGNIKVQGFFKNKKLTGEWTRFDREGNKTQIGHYKEGKKVGKWFVWSGDALKEINYDNNVIVSVHDWRSESKLAVNK